MIALGFSRMPSCHDDTVTFVRWGQVYILASNGQASRTPRSRARILVNCFLRGIDVVPLPPASMTPLSEVRSNPVSPQLLSTLAALGGKGQLTLSVPAPNPAPQFAASGKAWLDAKQHQHTRLQQIKAGLLDLAHAIALPAFGPHMTGSVISCDILVPRGAESDVRSDLAQVANKTAALDQSSLTICGLWPPFSFAHQHHDPCVTV